jgi:hypothetical protein
VAWLPGIQHDDRPLGSADQFSRDRRPDDAGAENDNIYVRRHAGDLIAVWKRARATPSASAPLRVVSGGEENRHSFETDSVEMDSLHQDESLINCDQAVSYEDICAVTPGHDDC